MSKCSWHLVDFPESLEVLASCWKHTAPPDHQLWFPVISSLTLSIFRPFSQRLFPFSFYLLVLLLFCERNPLGILHGTGYSRWHVKVFLQTTAVLSPGKSLANAILYVWHWHPNHSFHGACVYVNGLLSPLWLKAPEGRHASYIPRDPPAIAPFMVPCTE